jgi:hypothetical protein
VNTFVVALIELWISVNLLDAHFAPINLFATIRGDARRSQARELDDVGLDLAWRRIEKASKADMKGQ